MKKTHVSLLFILQIAIFAGPGPTPPSTMAEACTRDNGLRRLTADAAASNVDLQASQEPPVELRVLVGKSLVLNSRETLRRVSVADPSIVSAVSISPTQVMLNGMAAGKTTLILWNEQERSTAYDVLVEYDIAGLRETLAQLAPNENIQVAQAGASILLSGTASAKEVSDRATALALTQSKNVVNLIVIPQVSGGGEVLLQVRFAEVDRTAVQQLGINIFSTGIGNTPGRVTTGQFSAPTATDLTSVIPGQNQGFRSQLNLGDLLNIFIFRPDLNLGATIRLLQQKSVLQILAEPNLLALNGREASFLAGGEFPFPVVQTGTGLNSVTITFKEFGVRLKFTPNILPDGTIRLKVAPEVSSLDFANGLNISGFLVPALSTRRAETEVELKDGQSFAIAGLIDNRLTEVANKVPGLGDLPIIGKLFRSVSKNKSNSELLVMVTPKLVKPLAPGQVPTLPSFDKPFIDKDKFDGKTGEAPPKKKN